MEMNSNRFKNLNLDNRGVSSMENLDIYEQEFQDLKGLVLEIFEGGKHNFEKDGFLAPVMFIMENEQIDGKYKVQLVPVPMIDKAKEQFLINTVLKQIKPKAFLFISEGWLKKIKAEDKEEADKQIAEAMEKGIKNCDDKEECVFFQGESANCEFTIKDRKSVV